MTCPSCNIALLITERQQIEIDYCPACRGVWLDRGELDKLIERSARPEHRNWIESRPHDVDERSYGRKPLKKKRESFLGELFDF